MAFARFSALLLACLLVSPFSPATAGADSDGIDRVGPTLRDIETPLVKTSPRFLFSLGNKSVPVTADRFGPGDMVVVDLILPATTEGYLHAFIAANDYTVFHLLPMQNRTDHRLSEIGDVTNDGIREIRIAWPVHEASPSRPGLMIDPDERCGPLYVVAVVTDEPLFDPVRETAEDWRAFKPALLEAVAAADPAHVLVQAFGAPSLSN